MTPLERADRVRALCDDGEGRVYDDYGETDLLPTGSLILTPDEAEKVLCALAVPWRKRTDEARALLAGKGQA